MLPVADVVPQRRPFPIVTLLLVLANVVVFIYELTLPPDALNGFISSWGLVPYTLTGGSDRAPAPVSLLTLVTSMFIHGGFLHIFGNMLFLWVFGDNVEGAFGHLTYLVFYFICGIVAGLAQVAVSPASQVPGIGASGAIAGVLAAYLLLFPHARVRTLLFLGPFITLGWVAAVVLIGFWFLLQLFEAVVSLGAITQATGGVAYFAHVGGFLTGLALTLLIRGERHEGVADVNPLHGFLWNATFRNWVVLAVGLLLAGGVAALVGSGLPLLGVLLRGAVIAAAACLALFDAVRRILGRPSVLGPGRGWGRLLAFVQLGLSLAALAALLSL